MHHPKTKITCTNKIGPVITKEVGEVEEGGLQESNKAGVTCISDIWEGVFSI